MNFCDTSINWEVLLAISVRIVSIWASRYANAFSCCETWHLSSSNSYSLALKSTICSSKAPCYCSSSFFKPLSIDLKTEVAFTLDSIALHSELRESTWIVLSSNWRVREQTLSLSCKFSLSRAFTYSSFAVNALSKHYTVSSFFARASSNELVASIIAVSWTANFWAWAFKILLSSDWLFTVLDPSIVNRPSSSTVLYQSAQLALKSAASFAFLSSAFFVRIESSCCRA